MKKTKGVIFMKYRVYVIGSIVTCLVLSVMLYYHEVENVLCILCKTMHVCVS